MLAKRFSPTHSGVPGVQGGMTPGGTTVRWQRARPGKTDKIKIFYLKLKTVCILLFEQTIPPNKTAAAQGAGIANTTEPARLNYETNALDCAPPTF